MVIEELVRVPWRNLEDVMQQDAMFGGETTEESGFLKPRPSVMLTKSPPDRLCPEEHSAGDGVETILRS